MSSSRYAKGTSVSSARTVDELQRLLVRFGAGEFCQATSVERRLAGVMFTIGGITYRVTMPLPSEADREFTHTPQQRQKRTADAARKAYDEEVRRRWRALGLVIKAKLVAVEEGVVTLEAEFLPYAVLGSGLTVADEAVPRMQEAVRSGLAPSVRLLGLPEARGEAA
jgi:hypothetical protein